MNGIVPIGGSIGGPGSLGAASAARRPVAPSIAAPLRGQDHVELSQEAGELSAAKGADDVRMELVQRVRADIAAGLYETPDKIDAAVDALADEIAQSQLRLSNVTA